MPWTTDEDVKKHKADLSKKGMAQWRRIANSVLKKLMAKGMAEKEAAISAIKQANGVVMNANESKGKYSVYKNKQVLDYEVKLTVHQEKAHLVIPVVMMVEGVHNGNQGPIFHSIDELGKFPESWNGIPVVITHPEDDGMAVSANSPDIIDKMTVGRVYNTVVDGKKLKAEVWLDEDKLNNLSEKTLEDVNETKEVEVSLGMFTENEMEDGEYEGKKYVAIAHNHRPDHLAILPDQIGACSCADGCGLGANEKNKDMAKLIDVEKTIKQLNSEGFSINQIGNNKEQGYNEKMSMVNVVLRKMDKDWEDEKGGHHYEYNYLEELYDDSLIYSKGGNVETKMYKQTYKIESGKIEFVGEPIEVHKKVEYVVNSGWVRNKVNNNNKKEDEKMAEKCTPCIEKKVNELIANSQGFAETDREMLQALSEVQLDKLVVKKTDGDTEDEMMKKEEMKKKKEKMMDQKEKETSPIVQTLSAEDQADLAWAKKLRKEKRDAMIKGIQDNTEKGIWNDVELNSMTEDMLEKVFKAVKKEEAPVDYSLMGAGGFAANARGEEPLYPAGIEIKK